MANTNFDTEIANPYAEALFNSTLELYIKENYNNKIFFETLLDVEYILKLINSSSVIENCLMEANINDVDKKIILETCFSSRNNIYSITKDFLIYLVNKKRIESIQIILPIFIKKAEDFLSIQFVEVCSSSELTYSQQQRVFENLKSLVYSELLVSQIYSPQISVKFTIDPNLLGGFTVKINSKFIDLSLRKKLQFLSEEMEKRWFE
uniref:ATP synthase subunit delta, chloroplastic n=1 Tax=Dictyopteris divaricata TaxID=156996 RepID=A0A2I4Q285_9PHAE|nr:ATP synthase CF1 delta chain [Dictyopteris divaricata]YP_010205260.1 ATP synthase CF1 delta chain [Grateloupia livida]AQZ24968.1 ATP synthase CF1 delta chain [Dictyopteris divaricata]UAV85829.1 ATP synthase CF1 delta chain [Grateloupia livida]